MEIRKEIAGNRVITGEKTRWSYCHVLNPIENDNGRMLYSVSLIIPKDDTKTIDAIMKSLHYTFNTQIETLKGKNGDTPNFDDIALPLNDGDVERPNDSVYKNSYYINAKTDYQPKIIDKKGRKLTDEKDVYSGCYGRVSLTFYAYRKNKNAGIGAGLNNMLKCSDGECLNSVISAESDFAEFLDIETLHSVFAD